MKTALEDWFSLLQAFKSQLSFQWRNSVLPAFFGWWYRELIACLPKPWRDALEISNREVLLYWRAGVFWCASGTEATPFALSANDKQRRHVVLMPREQILLTPVQLPAAASSDINTVLAFEMDKYTPFKASQVYFDLAHKPADSSNPSSLNLQLVVVLRDRLDAVLHEASQSDHRVDIVDALDDLGERLNVNLLTSQLRSRNANPSTRRHKWLFCVGLALVISVMLLWVHNRQSALEEMSTQVHALRSSSQQTQMLEQQLNGILNEGRYVQDKKTEALSKASLLRELSICIPSNTWLEQLEINQEGTVSLSGQSGQASELIGKMKACAGLESLQFQGIIQPDTSTGLDRFSLTAHLRNKDEHNASAPNSP